MRWRWAGGGWLRGSAPTDCAVPAPATPPTAYFTYHLPPTPTHRVTRLESERRAEGREQQERFLADLRAEVERQAAAKGVAVRLPPPAHGEEGTE